MGGALKTSQKVQNQFGPMQAIGKGPKDNSDLANLMNDESGKPSYPGFTSLLDKETGLLPEKYKLAGQLDTAALDKLQSEALSQGPTSWAQLQLDKQAQEQALGLDKLAKQASGGVADVQSRLAMRGGLSSGAAERAARGGMRGLLEGQQAAQAAGEQQKLGILSQDAAAKMNLLQQLPGMQLQKSGFGVDIDKFNLGNTFQQKQMEEQAKLAAYQEQMKAYAAKKAGLATAMGGGGKKG